MIDTPAQPGTPQPHAAERTRTGLSVPTLKRALLDNLFYLQGRFPDVATLNDYYLALAFTVRDRMLQRWICSAQSYKRERSRTVCFLSAEYLPGPHLGNNMINLKIMDNVRQAVTELGLNLDDILDQEEDPGLGNGGLGRLAACYMDSLAALRIPAIGYGLRYEFGIFDQEIQDGWQVEKSDRWLRFGNPWEMARHSLTFDIKLGGHTEKFTEESGEVRVRWVPGRVVRGVAHDTPILGYGVNNANLLRLWKSEAPESFDFRAFNIGDYYGAVDQKVISENICKVLYPNDEPVAGKQLRLEQQYFLVSCSMQDMLRIFLQQPGARLDDFHEKYAVQLNDTHPALAIPELMRLLVDEHHMDWDDAWEVTRKTFSYTNHTLLPEALERWPVALFQRVLPRHYEIILHINERFLDEVRIKYRGDDGRVSHMSVIDESGERFLRMANLACVGSHAINGVAHLHTELLKKTVLHDFHSMWPEKFSNKTNGVSPRRFVLLNNMGLARLIGSRIGCDWPHNLDSLRGLEPFADDAAFQDEWCAVKRANKARLAQVIRERTRVKVDPDSLFDVQVKRIHEYKRQHLNLLHVITLYNRLKADPHASITPRTIIFGGKAAPGYRMAKLIIKLIHSVADVVNRDPEVRDLLKVVFLPDFNVKNSARIYPAADLSEQISTAGMEASGTGNMKFSMNGALTIGTLDGANIEIREEVGEENFFLFGLTAEEVEATRAAGYRPADLYQENVELREALDLLVSGVFSHGDRDLFRPILDGLLQSDPYMLLADYSSYVAKQKEVSQVYRDRELWTRMSILNVARMGKFSSDRAVREYCEEIWRVSPVDVGLPADLRPS